MEGPKTTSAWSRYRATFPIASLFCRFWGILLCQRLWEEQNSLQYRGLHIELFFVEEGHRTYRACLDSFIEGALGLSPAIYLRNVSSNIVDDGLFLYRDCHVSRIRGYQIDLMYTTPKTGGCYRTVYVRQSQHSLSYQLEAPYYTSVFRFKSKY